MSDPLEVAKAQHKILELDQKIQALKEVMKTAPREWRRGFELCREEDRIRKEWLEPGLDQGSNIYMTHNRWYHKFIAEHRARKGNGLELMERYAQASSYVTSGRAAQDLEALKSERKAYRQIVKGFHDSLAAHEEAENQKVQDLQQEVESLLGRIRELGGGT